MAWGELLTINSNPSKPLNELIAESSGAIGHKPVRTKFASYSSSSSATTGSKVLEITGGNKKRILGVYLGFPLSGTYVVDVVINGESYHKITAQPSSNNLNLAITTPDYVVSNYIFHAASATVSTADTTQISGAVGRINVAYKGCKITLPSYGGNNTCIMQPIENVDTITIKVNIPASKTVNAYVIYEQD